MKKAFTLSSEQIDIIETAILESDEIIDVHMGSDKSFADEYLGHNSANGNKSTSEISKNYKDRRKSYLSSLDIFVTRQLSVS